MIELKNVSFNYSSGQMVNGLKDINLKINRGEVVVLCGESGCGKTTMTRIINGLIPHYYEGELNGDIEVNGKDIANLPLYETAKFVGSVFQNPRSQFFNVDTNSELAFGCENMGLPPDEIHARIDEVVKQLKVERLLGKSLFKLSGGEKQKIACASVSTCQPDILVLDEPSSNLDIAAIEDLKNMIASWKAQGKTVVIAEHRLHYLSKLADWLVYMKQGRIERVFEAQEFQQIEHEAIIKMGLRPLSLENCTANYLSKTYDENTIEFSDVTFAYKDNPLSLNIDSLSIPCGAVTAVVGYNGAGKSTFARCLCGLEKKCKGCIRIKGSDVKHTKRLKQCYMVMQDVNHQLFTESVLDEVMLSIGEQDTSLADDILKSMDLIPFKENHPMSLSGGQKQRVAIASAVASGKDIIIFDEPTSGLDLKHMREVAQSIRDLEKMGKTIYVISHDLELIMSCCNYVIHFEEGYVKNHYPMDGDSSNRLISFFTGTE